MGRTVWITLGVVVVAALGAVFFLGGEGGAPDTGAEPAAAEAPIEEMPAEDAPAIEPVAPETPAEGEGTGLGN